MTSEKLPAITSLTKSTLLTILSICLIVVGFSAISGYFLIKYKSAQQELNMIKNNPGAVVEKENEMLVNRIRKYMDLPPDEKPTIATVTDVSQLQSQPFFARVQVGHKVLVYNVAKKAILYDPNADRVIEVGPLVEATPTPGGQQLGETTQLSPTPTPKAVTFVLYNGTTTTGLTNTYEVELQKKIQNAQVTDRANANVRTYEKTSLIDLVGNSETASQIATTLGVELVALPQGETAPENVDYLIILGQDRL